MTALYHSAQFSTIPATSGIYRIRCTVTSKCYIGSSVNLQVRWRAHQALLQRNAHHSPPLQRAWNKYGPDVFHFEIIELVLPGFLLEREQYWLDKLRPWDKRGYNIAHSSEAARLGLAHSPQTRNKMQLSAMGHAPTNARTFILTSPEGVEHVVYNLPAFCKEHGLNPGLLIQVARGNRRHCKKWTARYQGDEARTESIEDPRKITLIITSPDGIEYIVTGIRQFCKERGLHHTNLLRVARGEQKQHKGWRARFPDAEAS